MFFSGGGHCVANSVRLMPTLSMGRSSERITRQIEQLEELETGEAEDVARAEANEPEAPVSVRARRKRRPLPDHLLR
jgi:hypothetical protein